MIMGAKASKSATALLISKTTDSTLAARISPRALMRQQGKEEEWSPHVEEAVEAKALQALQQADRQGAGTLSQLPPELLLSLLSFLDYEALLKFGQTCAWAYGVVHHQCTDVVMTKLGHQLRAVESPPPAEQQTAEGGVKGGGEESKAATVPLGAGLTKEEAAEQAVRLMVTNRVRREAQKPEGTAITDFQSVFNPKEPERRMAVIASIRLFSVPKALYRFQEKLGETLARALRGVEVELPEPENAKWDEVDAWSVWGQVSPLPLGAELVPVTLKADFDKIIRANEEIRLWSDKTVRVRVPSAEDALRALGSLVNSDEVLLWHDPTFKARGYTGCKFLVVGGGRGCVIQWEYYSNYCGGPYASYSCGMG